MEIEEEAENLKELKKYDRTHNFDDPDFLKNRPSIILKKRGVRRSPLPLRILRAVRRLFDEGVRADKKAGRG